MDNNLLNSSVYDSVRHVIRSLSQKYSWQEIYEKKFLRGRTFEEFNEDKQDQDMYWPSVNWEEFIYLCKTIESANSIKEPFRIISGNDREEIKAPVNPNSSWKQYVRKLHKKGFSEDSIQNVQKQCKGILSKLEAQTIGKNPVKGLAIGNVQSGKTANIAGLMAMAADYGWNFFAVLTGLTENLRQQTEDRLMEDLISVNSTKVWTDLTYAEMERKNFPYQDFSDRRRVFFNVCLKNKKRLRTLIRFLQKDPNPENLRILIIDDEADQGSVNTGDISKNERKEINRLILKLVYGEGLTGDERKGFGALNYVSFTATPYANCLNEGESTDDNPTLYPDDFIALLEPGKGYFGPAIIFGDTKSDDLERINIVNFIDDQEKNEVKLIEKGLSDEIPESMMESILWFICAAAVQRFRRDIKPVSMLIHTNFAVSKQDLIYDAIRNWLIKIKNNAVTLCEPVYKKQISQFTKDGLERVYPDYEYLSEVKKCPEYSEIVPYIQELTSEITSIRLDEEQEEENELIYNTGIILCEDNSKSKGLDEEGNHLRLVYPTKMQLREMGYGPAFIVIGGNTLSRGLTLEGLVSSYFMRNSSMADSLMQMGRWFGYRKGYELLPRIWMREETFEKFQNIVDIDSDLREQIRDMTILNEQGQNYRPADFGLALLTSPKATWLRLTDRRKMQSAVVDKDEYDFTGSDMQLTSYKTKTSVIRKNNHIVEHFLSELGTSEISLKNGVSAIWNNIPFDEIDKNIFEAKFSFADSSRTFQDFSSFRIWAKKQTELKNLDNWTVILAGTKPSNNNPEKNIQVPNTDRMIGKVNRDGKISENGNLTIKVLTNKADYVSHLKPEDFQNSEDEIFTWNNMIKDPNISRTYNRYLMASEKRHTPILLFYCVDKNSTSKRHSGLQKELNLTNTKTLTDLGIEDDFYGMAIVIPGIRGKSKQRVKLKAIAKIKENSDED